MIEPDPLTTPPPKSRGLQSNSLIKTIKRGNSDVPRFQYKVIVVFHIKLKIFPRLSVKVVNTCKIHC